jgi:hypothetical protein
MQFEIAAGSSASEASKWPCGSLQPHNSLFANLLLLMNGEANIDRSFLDFTIAKKYNNNKEAKQGQRSTTTVTTSIIFVSQHGW